MLDSTKIPELQEGEYPNYWNIDVEEVRPLKDSFDIHRQACYVLIHSFTNINDFLVWYSKEAWAHELVQSKVSASNVIMQNIKICRRCHRTRAECDCLHVQSGVVHHNDPDLLLDEISETFVAPEVVEEPEPQFRFIGYFFYLLLKGVLMFPYLRLFVFWFLDIHYVNMFCATFLYQFLYRCDNISYRFVGARIQRYIGYHPEMVKYVKVAGVILACPVLIRAISMIVGYFTPTENLQSEGHAPMPMERERDNVWYKETFNVTTFDVTPQTTSWKDLPPVAVQSRLQRNTFFMQCASLPLVADSGKKSIAVNVGGHIFMTNNHSIPTGGDLRVNLTQSDDVGVSSGLTFSYPQENVLRFPDLDVAFIVVKSLPPCKTIVDLFCKSSLKGIFSGVYLNPLETLSVDNIRLYEDTTNDVLEGRFDYWRGETDTPTYNGLCGSPLVARSFYGPVILGIHQLGVKCKSAAVRISRDDLYSMIGHLLPKTVGAGVPILQSDSASLELGPLHKKSPVRYIRDGTAHVYGSFKGFRSAPKSHVEPTYIFPVLEKYGYKTTHGKPMMNGYIPWRRALTLLTDPITDLDLLTLDNVVKDFTHDIMEQLTDEDLSMVHVLDNKSAMNGTPGVTYVDGINRSTSAGNPWKKSKKFFLQDDFCEIYPDGVAPVEEIQKRFERCEATYAAGERYHPVFCAHLKDEPTKLASCEIGKTRVFTGAPFEWSLVVRKYLLSIVRVIQHKRFVFESAPGIVAQSTEWQDLRAYLCKFGDQNLVAGDYAAFDKRMPSTVILAAYDIILSVCKRAGYSEEDMRIVRGIATDTAFPLVDFNGDLIEFYGSNPSGHPLTVIVNGLANSLYVRYAFAKLSPERTARSFKKCVNFMSYGDDNVMGVSSRTPWFNHTSISQVLGEVGIVYTMADKLSTSIPFISIDDVSFLKRRWRWDVDVGAFLAPLEVASIHKMLTSCVVSKSITREAQAIAVIETALREYFYYGKQTFTKKREFLLRVVEEAALEKYVERSTFPTWDELKIDFWDHSAKLQNAPLSQEEMDGLDIDVQVESTHNCLCCGVGPLDRYEVLCDFCFIEPRDLEEEVPSPFVCSHCKFPERYE